MRIDDEPQAEIGAAPPVVSPSNSVAFSGTVSRDQHFMRLALAQAAQCLDRPSGVPDDVPIGAICVIGDMVVGVGHNRREAEADPTAHAELLALRAAALHLGRRELTGVTLYVTLEPCPMCAGALWLSRIDRLVFGAWDAKAGACGSVFDIPRDVRLNHRPQVRGGVLKGECAEMLKGFFAGLRG